MSSASRCGSKAVKKAGTTDPDKVIDALPGIKAPNLTGGISEMLPNHHITKPVFIGEVRRRRPVRRGVEDRRPRAGRRLVAASSKAPRTWIADWVKLKCGNYNTVTKKCGGQAA